MMGFLNFLRFGQFNVLSVMACFCFGGPVIGLKDL
jgi:hypothetical protein